MQIEKHVHEHNRLPLASSDITRIDGANQGYSTGDGEESELQRKEPNIPQLSNDEAALNNGRTEDSLEERVAKHSKKQKVTFDELKDKQQDEVGKKYQLVCLMQLGWTPRAALKHAGLKHDESWARKLLNKCKEQGPASLIDGRSGNKRKTVIEGEVEIILLGCLAKSAAGPKAITEMVEEICEERNQHKKSKLIPPSLDAIKRYKKKMPHPLKLFLEGKRGIEQWSKQGRPVGEYEETEYGNEYWQTDHCRLKIWVKVKEDGKWVPREVWFSAYLDVDSRSVPGFSVSTKYPDAMTSLLLMAHAINRKKNKKWKNKGRPVRVRPDNGRDFKSAQVKLAFARLGIILDFAKPYHPDGKGNIERFFRTLYTSCISKLPGCMAKCGTSRGAAEKIVDSLLTLQQLRELIEAWIVEDYHQRTHSATGRKPAELWEERARIYMPRQTDLNSLLMKTTPRTITNRGIQLMIDGFKGRFWAPELTDFWRQKVEVRYNPDDLNSVIVYSVGTGKFICEAWLMGKKDSRYTKEDILTHRSQFKRGLRERIKDYREEVERNDRPTANRAALEKVRRKIQELEDETIDEDSADAEQDQNDENSVAEFRRKLAASCFD
jgi:putative transposase